MIILTYHFTSLINSRHLPFHPFLGIFQRHRLQDEAGTALGEYIGTKSMPLIWKWLISMNWAFNLFTSRPDCMSGSRDPGVTIVNPTEISVMYGYVTWRMTTEISVMYGSEGVKGTSSLMSFCFIWIPMLWVYDHINILLFQWRNQL